MWMIELEGFVANDPAVWFRAARYIQALSFDTTLQMLQAQFPDRFPQDITHITYEDGPNITRTMAFTTQYETIVIMRGMSSDQQLPQLINGWKTQSVNNTSWQVNQSFYDAARQLLLGLPLAFVDPTKQITWIGYSYGGAVAQVAAALQWHEQRIPANCISFGAPRVGGRQFAQAQMGTRLTKIMNATDGVASIPPHYNESAIFWYLWTQQDSGQGVSAQVQSYPVFVMNEAGQAGWYTSDYRSPEQAAADVRRWLQSPTGFLDPSHALSLYIARLAALTSEGAQTYGPPPIRTHGTPVNPTPSQSTMTSRAGSLAVQFAGRDPTSAMSQFAATQVQLTNSSIYRARRDSKKTWGVRLGADWITRGLKKRQAKRRARQLNLAKRVQRLLA